MLCAAVRLFLMVHAHGHGQWIFGPCCKVLDWDPGHLLPLLWGTGDASELLEGFAEIGDLLRRSSFRTWRRMWAATSSNP